MYAMYSTLQKPYDFSEVDMLSIRRWWCGQLLETFTLESPAGLAGRPISPSPHLSHTLQSPSSESPAGLADTPISPSPSPHLSHTFQSRSCPSGTPITTEDSPFLPPVVLQRIIEETEYGHGYAWRVQQSFENFP
ncbi:hypothetical protein R3I94_006975 [Phoxinus phoxinus]